MFGDEDESRSAFLTVKQAAEVLGYSERGVRKLIEDGWLRGQRVGGGRKWLIHKESIDQYLGTSSPTKKGGDQQWGDHLHQEELQSLLGKWLEIEEEVTLDSWLGLVVDYFLSPSGLLTWAQDTLRVLSQDPAVERSDFSLQDARDSQLDNYALQRALLAPPGIIESPLFPSLQEHLIGDPIWELWAIYIEAQANLAAQVWTRAIFLFRFTFGLLIALPADTRQEVSKIESINRIQPIVENPYYRDAVSQFLKAAVYLLGAWLIRKGVQEAEQYPNSRVAIARLGRLMQEEEDQIQRLPLPEHWVLPKAGLIREIAAHIWDGSLDEEPSKNLGPAVVSDLLNLWQKFNRASVTSQRRLKTLVAIQRFPGMCSDCLESQLPKYRNRLASK